MEISIKSESERFQQFLLEENNNNIIFSGIYGIGKSYFINDFFNNQHPKEYIPIILTPVNYSVANNEDIFEYIKADILLQLLGKVACDLKECKISTSVATYYYIKNNLGSIIGNILSTAEKVCFQTDIINQLLKLRENIKQFQESDPIQEDKEIEKFITGLSQKQGSIYESNIITQIIQTLISNAKEEEENHKEAVLVIDDLDRIDPEHIFRILNIFSAHNDFCGGNEHKFKFDKTILVCDIENIRKIFHAKYGADVDFSGYIDKFYSKEIFHFDNVNEIAKCIANQVVKINSDSDIFIEDNYSHIALVFILRNLINYNLINIRTLEKFEYTYNIGHRCILYNTQRYSIALSPALTIFEFLKRVSGSPEALMSKFEILSMKNKFYNKYDENYIPQSFIILADLQNNQLTKTEQLNYKGINYNIDVNKPMLITNNVDYKSLDEVPVNLFEMIYDAYSNY
ncbi:P-loop NTPase fold protein, partial [Phocaeicola sp. KGMB11183]